MIIDQLAALAVPVDSLTPLPGNPRVGDVPAVARSLETFGQRKPIVVDAAGVVIAGNHTLQAAKSLGWETIAVVRVNDDEVKAKAFALADNRTGDLGTYDDDALLDMLYAVEDDPALLAAAGYSRADIDALVDTATEDDYTQKIEAPIYEPTGPCPKVSDLCDRAKADELLAEIAAVELPAEVGEFLRWAAERHVRFKFSAIAEFYAHAEPKVQRLFEASALVIIDFDQALERGYVRMNEAFLEQFGFDVAE